MRRRTGTKYIPVHRQEKGVDSKVSKWEKIGVVSNIILSVLTLVVTINLTAHQNRLSERQAEISQMQFRLEERAFDRDNSPIFTFSEKENTVEIKNQGAKITNANIIASKMLDVLVVHNGQYSSFYYNYPMYYKENSAKYNFEHSSFRLNKNTEVTDINNIIKLFESKLEVYDIEFSIIPYDFFSISYENSVIEFQSLKYTHWRGDFRKFLGDVIDEEFSPENLTINTYDSESTYDDFVDDILKKIGH